MILLGGLQTSVGDVTRLWFAERNDGWRSSCLKVRTARESSVRVSDAGSFPQPRTEGLPQTCSAAGTLGDHRHWLPTTVQYEFGLEARRFRLALLSDLSPLAASAFDCFVSDLP
jgi:hypothetical protein